MAWNPSPQGLLVARGQHRSTAGQAVPGATRSVGVVTSLRWAGGRNVTIYVGHSPLITTTYTKASLVLRDVT